jgi:GNAT superfamily N-acetyltransferase
VNQPVDLKAARGDSCDLAPIRGLRLQLLGIPGQAAGSLPGDDAYTTWHVTAWVGDRLVATSTLVADPAPFDREVAWRLRAAAVRPDFRGAGLGTVLVQERLLICGSQAAWAEVRAGASLAVHTKVGALVMGEPKPSAEAWHSGPMVQVLHESGVRPWVSQLSTQNPHLLP